MDSTPEDTARIAHEHNAARNAERRTTMASESAAALANLSVAFPYLVDWHRAMEELQKADPADWTTRELTRLTRVAGIAADSITEARAHTAEARRISRELFPEKDSEPAPEGR